MMTIAPGRAVAALVLLAAFAGRAAAQDKEKAKAHETPPAPQQVTHTIKGRVVDQSGKPRADVTVANHWNRSGEGADAPYQPVKTGADGTFAIELTFYYGQSNVLAAYSLDKAAKQGGLVIVEPKSAREPVTLTIGPLVRVHGSYHCKELDKPVGWTNTMVFAMPTKVRFNQYQSDDSTFEFWLPPGQYLFQGYGSSEVDKDKRELTLSADKPEIDLGAIDLPASKIAKLKGKPAPTLLPTDAHGVSKSVQIADYRGKWVALEFWGYWCGPCVGGALPHMMEIYDDHENERDRFVVLTVHSPETKTFADLDEKVKPVVRDVWAGRMIPFPILLDGESKLQQTFGVSHWPTTLLFDPDGKLIGEVQPDALEAKLAKVPPEVALPRKLDRNTTIFFDNPTLGQALTMLKQFARAEFELDKEAIAALGISETTKVPLTISGQVSLRSALDLLLDPVDLAGQIGPGGYVITRKAKGGTSPDTTLSAFQQKCAERIERKLKESKYSYNFDSAPLAKVAAFFEQRKR